MTTTKGTRYVIDEKTKQVYVVEPKSAGTNFNPMCKDCLCYGYSCSGTTNQALTDCIYRKTSE